MGISGGAVGRQHGPASNELPVPVASNVIWRGEGIALAIPSLLVYTAGIEILTLVHAQLPIQRNAASVRRDMNDFYGMRVNGAAVDVLGGEASKFRMIYRLWSEFDLHLTQEGSADIAFRLSSDVFDADERIVPGVLRLRRDVIRLWD